MMKDAVDKPPSKQDSSRRNLRAVQLQGLSKTGEHTSIKRDKGWSCVQMSTVCVCVHTARPGDSQAYNYTLVGVKLITEGEKKGEEEKLNKRRRLVHSVISYLTPALLTNNVDFLFHFLLHCYQMILSKT